MKVEQILSTYPINEKNTMNFPPEWFFFNFNMKLINTPHKDFTIFKENYFNNFFIASKKLQTEKIYIIFSNNQTNTLKIKQKLKDFLLITNISLEKSIYNNIKRKINAKIPYKKIFLITESKNTPINLLQNLPNLTILIMHQDNYLILYNSL